VQRVGAHRQRRSEAASGHCPETGRDMNRTPPRVTRASGAGRRRGSRAPSAAPEGHHRLMQSPSSFDRLWRATSTSTFRRECQSSKLLLRLPLRPSRPPSSTSAEKERRSKRQRQKRAKGSWREQRRLYVSMAYPEQTVPDELLTIPVASRIVVLQLLRPSACLLPVLVVSSTHRMAKGSRPVDPAVATAAANSCARQER